MSSAPGRSERFRRPARDWDRVAVAAIGVGALMRIGWILVLHPPARYVYSDMLGYVSRAQGLVSGRPLVPGDAFFPPGTDLLLSLPLGLFGLDAGLWVATVLWCVLSIVTVFLAWRLGRALLSPAAAAVTTVLCAVWPLFITYGGYFTSETPALAFLVAALWAGTEATRRADGSATTFALLAGVMGGCAAAVRPQLLINAVIVAVVVLRASRSRGAVGAALGVGLVSVLALVVVHNSVASGQLVGLARNGGVNFWFGHCAARSVTTVDAQGRPTYAIRHPVPAQAGRAGDYVVRGHTIEDESEFTRLGWACIEQDGLGHLVRLGRNVLDMTATTTPWPQSEGDGWPRTVVQVANVSYAVLLPWVVIEGIGLARRRRRAEEQGQGQVQGQGQGQGLTILLGHLACVAVVAVLVIGDPRVRSVYDVVGLAVLAALLADRLRLDEAHPQ